MQHKINSAEEYRQIMEKVEAYLQKTTYNGGFHSLSLAEQEELQRLCLLAEAWEGRALFMSRQS